MTTRFHRIAHALAIHASVIAAGCAATPHGDPAPTPVATVATPADAAPTTAPATVENMLPSPPDQVSLRVSAYGSQWGNEVLPQTDGTKLLILGGHRAQWQSGRIAWAEERFANEIVLAVPTAHGWVFLARDGTVAAAESFLGPLHRLGQMHNWRSPASDPRSMFWGSGRAAFVDADGSVLATDGAEPLAPLALTPGALASEVLFALANRGVAQLRDGTLLATSDGGAHWSRVPRRETGEAHLAYDDTGAAPRILLQGAGSARTHELSAANRLVSVPLPTVLRSEYFSAAEWADIARAGREHEPALRDMDHRASFVRADGRVLRLGEANGDVEIVDPETGRVLETHAHGLPVGPRAIDQGVFATAHCELHPWGAAIAAVCRDGPPGYRAVFHLLRSDDGVTFHSLFYQAAALSLHAASGDTDTSALGEDGLTVANVSACVRNDPDGPLPDDLTDPSQNAKREGSLCVSRDGGITWQTVASTVQFKHLLGMHNGRVLAILRTASQTEPWRSSAPLGDMALVNVADGRAQPLPLEPTLNAAQYTAYDGGLLPNGTLFVIVSTQPPGSHLPGVHSVLVGNESALRLRALPEGALRAAFVDARHGYATGSTAAQVWHTLDAGETWERLDVPMDGAPESVVIDWTARERREPSRMNCVRDVCGADRVLVGPAVRTALDQARIWAATEVVAP